MATETNKLPYPTPQDASGFGQFLEYIKKLQESYRVPVAAADPTEKDAAAWTQTQYWTDFAESLRRYQLDQQESTRRFDAELAWVQKQYQQDFAEAQRRYDQEFPWLKKRDAVNAIGRQFIPNARFLSV